MIIECPECGTKNTTDEPPQPGKRYRCGKCGVTITFLQNADASSETTSPPITNRISNISIERTSSYGRSPTSTKVNIAPFESGHSGSTAY